MKQFRRRGGGERSESLLKRLQQRYAMTHDSQYQGISDLVAQTGDALAEISFMSYLFPHMKEA